MDFGTLKNASFMILLGLLPSVYFLFLYVGRSMTYFRYLMLKFNDLSREISPSVLSCSVSFGTSPSPSFFFFSFFFWSATSPSFSCLPFRLFFRFLYLFPFLSFFDLFGLLKIPIYYYGWMQFSFRSLNWTIPTASLLLLNMNRPVFFFHLPP